MNRPTLAMVRASSLPAAVGLCAADISAVAAVVNEAQERLLTDPMAPEEGWWGGWATMLFNVVVLNRTGYITTPRNVARILVMDICNRPVQIRNGFYEYLQFGTGLHPKTHNTCNTFREVFERDSVVTLYDLLSTPQQIRIYPTDASDVDKRVLIQGADHNGLKVTSTDFETGQATLGEYVRVAMPFSTTINRFSTITGILKDTTVGPLSFYQVDPTTGEEVSLSWMEPGETTGYYRRYLLDGLQNRCHDGTCGIIQATVQARLDLIPVVSDPDYLLIQSIPALTEEAQSIRYSRMDSSSAPGLELKHHAKALQILNGQLDLYQGKTQTAISLKPFGSDRIKMQPV